jgi:hypothetical protein
VEDTGRPHKVPVEKRESASNLALLEVAGSNPHLEALRVAGDSSVTNWETVAVFRFRRGSRGGSADPELVLNGNRIELGETVDSSAFGSPIVTADGVIGVVQDENGGAAWAEVARVLKLDKSQSSIQMHHGR